MTGADLLVILGGALQIAGVVVLARDVVRSLRRLGEYQHRPQTIYAAGIVDGSGVGSATLTGGREPTTDERVAILETRLTALSAELESTRRELEESARLAAEGAAHRATLDARDRIGALERALLGDTPRDFAIRIGSVAAIALGVALQTLGAVVG